MTNWFRYGLSLEATYVAVPALLGVLIIAGTAFLAWRTSRVSIGALTVIAAAGFAISTVAAHRHAFGTFGPGLALNHIETSGIATLHAHNTTVRYELELHNPFASSHREYLIVRANEKTHRILVRVFDSAAAGYGIANQPSDWIILRPTADPNVYIAETGSFPAPMRAFRIDLRNSRAVAIDPAG